MPPTARDTAVVLWDELGGNQGQPEPPSRKKTTFPYLGRMVMYYNSDWLSLYRNLRKAQRRWGIVAEVLGKTWVLIKALGDDV